MLSEKPLSERSPITRYGVSLCIFLVALAVRFMLLPIEAGLAFLTFYPAVVLAFLLCGLGPGALASLTSALVGYYVFTPPFWSFDYNPQGELATLIFLFSCGLFGYVTFRLRSARQDALNALEATRKANAYIEFLYKATPAMLHSIDDQARLVDVSDVWLTTLGYAREDVIGRKIFEFLTPESRDVALHRNFPQFQREGSATNLEYQMVKKDGSVIDVLLSAVSHHPGGHEGRMSLAATIDISEKKCAERALRRSQTELQLITDHIPALVSHVDTDLRYLFANRTYQTWFGKNPADLVGTRLEDHYGREAFAAMEQPLRAALRGESFYCERPVMTQDGVRFCQVNFVPSRNAEGHIDGLIVLNHDVTHLKATETALRKSEAMLTRTGSVAGVGGWEYDVQTQQVTWSSLMYELMDVGRDYVPSVATDLDLFGPHHRAALERAFQECVLRGTAYDLETEVVTGKGRRCWLRTTGVADMHHGTVVRVIGAWQDVTVRKTIELELAQSYELVKTTLESIGDAVITTDQSGQVTWINPVAEKLTGWSNAAAIDRPLDDIFNIVNSVTQQPAVNPVTECLRLGHAVDLEANTLLMSADGATYGIEDTASPIRNGEGQILGAVLVFHDVSERMRMTQEMTHRATHDPLTELINRTEFETRVSRALEYAKSHPSHHVLMFIDLDEFKVVNDSCGHASGDLLLKKVSGMLLSSVRAQDTVARLGGDEFGILLEHCSVEHGQAIAQKICDQMEVYRFAHDGRKYRIGTSIGVVMIDASWTGFAALFQAADSCCYAAKSSGRNRLHVWKEADVLVSAHNSETRWVDRIVSGLDEDNFVLYAQRIEPVDANATGLHCEVLIRLKEPDGTLVMPGSFIPSAERFHLASRLDRWVVSRVIAKLNRLNADQMLRDRIDMIGVNVSGQSVGDRAFHRDFLKIVETANFDLAVLCVEITETAAITNWGDAKIFMDEVRSRGIRVALDDFGAGASSFGYLRNLTVDFLKIDGQFVTGILDDPLDDAAVRCFIEVAQAVGAKTIAEFVERADVRAELKKLGVDYVQGYLIHRPEPFKQLLETTLELVPL